MLDRLAYAGMRLWSPILLDVPIDELSLLARIEDIPFRTPIVFLSGTADQHAPLVEVDEIRRKAGDHAELVAFDGAAHHDLFTCDPARYECALMKLIGRIETQ